MKSARVAGPCPARNRNSSSATGSSGRRTGRTGQQFVQPPVGVLGARAAVRWRSGRPVRPTSHVGQPHAGRPGCRGRASSAPISGRVRAVPPASASSSTSAARSRVAGSEPRLSVHALVALVDPRRGRRQDPADVLRGRRSARWGGGCGCAGSRRRRTPAARRRSRGAPGPSAAPATRSRGPTPATARSPAELTTSAAVAGPGVVRRCVASRRRSTSDLESSDHDPPRSAGTSAQLRRQPRTRSRRLLTCGRTEWERSESSSFFIAYSSAGGSPIRVPTGGGNLVAASWSVNACGFSPGRKTCRSWCRPGTPRSGPTGPDARGASSPIRPRRTARSDRRGRPAIGSNRCGILWYVASSSVRESWASTSAGVPASTAAMLPWIRVPNEKSYVARWSNQVFGSRQNRIRSEA